jgi:hypothetical protein
MTVIDKIAIIKVEIDAMVSVAEAKLTKAQRKFQMLEAEGALAEKIAKRWVLVCKMFCHIHCNY